MSRSTISLPVPSLFGSLKSGMSERWFSWRQGAENLLVDLVADVGLALERHHVGKAGAWRDRDRRRKSWPAYLSLTYFMNSRTST